MRVLEDLFNWYSGYLLIDGPFDFGDAAFIARGIELMRQLAENRCFSSLPVNVWISRQLIGLRSIAFRLKARINMKRLSEEESIDDAAMKFAAYCWIEVWIDLARWPGNRNALF
jgi:hypothetical protein